MRYLYSIYIFFISMPSYSQDCIVPHLTNDTKTDWNPEWIKKNQVYKIIEREYLDSNQLHLVNYIYFDSTGYIHKKINGISYPNNKYPSEDNYFSAIYYRYENINGFIFQFDSIIRRHNEKGLMPKPDTLSTTFDYIYNPFKKKELNLSNSKILYSYDENGNLIKRENIPKDQDFILNYKNGLLKDIKSEVHGVPAFVPISKKTQDLFTYHANKISGTKDKFSGFSNQFYYNEKGEMIKQIELYKNRPQILRTFEFVRK